MKFQIVTLFPNLIESYLSEGVIHQAYKKQLFYWSVINPRDFAMDRHKSVDDRPFGGGDGMVMMPDILQKSLESREDKTGRVIYLTPQGSPLTEEKVKELAMSSSLTLICGRYGGVDQRALNKYVDEEISIGDYVLSGGELAALVVMDAVIRKIPGSLGHHESAESDSFSEGILEYPLFTRPQVWNSTSVPEVLVSGHHEKIKKWQKNVALLITWKKRPDLLQMSEADKKSLLEFYNSMSEEDKKACGLENLSGF